MRQKPGPKIDGPPLERIQVMMAPGMIKALKIQASLDNKALSPWLREKINWLAEAGEREAAAAEANASDE